MKDDSSLACPGCGQQGLPLGVLGMCPLCVIKGSSPENDPVIPEHWAPTPEGYELLEFISEGGGGEVWKAQQLKYDRPVAIKFFRSDQSSRFLKSEGELERFFAEIQITAQMEHSNIAHVYDSGVAEGLPFYAMEFIQGVPLDRIREHSQEEILRLFQQVCAGVSHAHEAGIIHRDLKPSNILVDRLGVAKLIDFGIAKLLEDDDSDLEMRTRTGYSVGTPRYFSPEQAGGDTDEWTAHTDIYSLGVILYQLLTGSFPHPTAGSTAELRKQICDDPPLLPQHANSSLDKEISGLLLKALEKKPEDRYQSVADFSADIDRYLNKQPLKARPAGLPYRIERWIARNKILATSALLGVLGLTSYVWQISHEQKRTEQARDQAEKNLRLAEENSQKILDQSFRNALTMIRLAASRGEWQQVVDLGDQTIASGYPDPISLRIEKIEALSALGRGEEARSELSELLNVEGIADEDQARLLLWKGSFQPELTEANSIKAAIELGLPPAEAAYAKGLLETRSQDALLHFENAIKLSPFHPRANLDLAMTELLLGYHEKAKVRLMTARLLFPDSPMPLVGLSMQAAMLGDDTKAKEQMDFAAKMAKSEDIQLLSDLLPIFQFLREWPLEQIYGVKNPESNSLSLAIAVARLALKDEKYGSKRKSQAYPKRLQAPFVKIFNGLMALSLTGDAQSSISKLKAAIEAHEEGSSYFYLACLHFGEGQWNEVISSAEKSISLPSMFPFHNAFAMDLLLTSQCVLGRETSNPELMKKGVINLEKRLTMEPPIGENMALNFVIYMRACGDHEAIRKIAEDQLSRNPEGLEFMLAKSQAELDLNNYGSCVAIAERVLALAANKPNEQKSAELARKLIQDSKISQEKQENSENE